MRKRTNILGKYRPQNPDKFRSKGKTAVYRSLWERKFMLWCDRSAAVIWWSSESIEIPYVSPKDDKWHTYYPDFFVVYVGKDGSVVEKLIEVKPYSQCKWAVNKAKWKAAREACKNAGWEFQVLTEREIKP